MSASPLSFDEDPQTYDRARPEYPPEHFDRLFDLLPDEPDIIEVGPGTGQATKDLLDRGANVTAVEPGPNLASYLRTKFASASNLTVVNDRFETANLESSSCDAVVGATAYHWVPPEHQLARPIDVLRRAGVLATLDMVQVDSPTDHGYFERAQSIYASYGQAKNVSFDSVTPTYDTATPSFYDRLVTSAGFDSVEITRVPWDQTYSSGQYRDLLMSYSTTLALDPAVRTDMLDQLVALIDAEFGGSVTRPLCATLTLAHPRAFSHLV